MEAYEAAKEGGWVGVSDERLMEMPKREWVGLTDEDIEQEFGFIDELLRDCVYRTEAKLKQKNGYAEEKNT